MFDIKEVQFLLKVLDSATIKGIEANQMVVQLAVKLSQLQQQLSVDAVEALKQPQLASVPTKELGQVIEDEEPPVTAQEEVV